MNTRAYILRILEQVVLDHGYANLLMRGMDDMPAKDRAFVSEVVYGTLRNYDLLSYQWTGAVSRKVRKKTAVLLNMSVYQLLFLDRVPAYAVISEAVELADRNEKKFVNAVLRKVQEEGKKQPDAADPLERAALLYSHPLWILRMWKAYYGEETALKIAAHDQGRAVVYGRINTLKTSREKLAAEPGVHFVNDISFTYDGVLTDTEWFRRGEVLIQDVASAMVPGFLDVREGMCVLDACAAPGTKAQQTAMLMNDKGKIIAGDLYPRRCELIAGLMARTGVTIVTPVVRDAAGAADEMRYDRILADVPCSGLGDLRGKPEIRMHITPEGLDELIALQKGILENCAGLLKPGGKLLYSTCTLSRKENEGQVSAFLARHPDFRLVREKTFFPFELDSDGFYAAQLEKIVA